MLTDEQLEGFAALYLAPKIEKLDMMALLRAVEAAAVAEERARCIRLRNLLDTIRLTVAPSAVNENLRFNIQMALHDLKT